MRWFGVLLLLVLGWITLLTVQVTDLYERNVALIERCNRLEIRAKELERELDTKLSLHQEDVTHTLEVQQSLLDATIKGVLEEW